MLKKRELSRLSRAAVAIMLVASLAAPSFLQTKVSAAASPQIIPRKLTLQAGAADGGSKPGGNVNHEFSFTVNSFDAGGTDTTLSIGSIKFQYCTTAAPVAGGIGCVAPVGMDVTAANLGLESGLTGFTNITKSAEQDGVLTVPNTIVISRTTASIPSAVTPSVYRFTGVINPSAPQTFFVRITTYASTNGTGTPNNYGNVAAATATQIVLNGTMPESLVFCAGKTVGLDVNNLPNCSTATAGLVDFDRLFSPTDTAVATSQMAASTNAGQGYAITVNGNTMTSGSNTITNMATAGLSQQGASQFGMNLVRNQDFCPGPAAILTTTCPDKDTIPNGLGDLGEDIAPTSNATNFKGEPGTGYGTTNNFRFNTGNVVAASDNGNLGNPSGTDSQIYTASYIVNVPGSQPAGTYTTTLTYICTPTF